MAKGRKAQGEFPIVDFDDQAAWEKWLEENHAKSNGVWLRLTKRVAGVHALTYAEALEVALCYGWIDGQKQTHSPQAWLQKFTPRRKKSIWSKINREKALALIENGRMRPAGLNQIELAKADGRWEAAYDSFSAAVVPADFQAALNKNPKAKAFFATVDRANRYAFLFRIQTAKKPETRAKRIDAFVKMLSKKEKLHP